MTASTADKLVLIQLRDGSSPLKYVVWVRRCSTDDLVKVSGSRRILTIITRTLTIKTDGSY